MSPSVRGELRFLLSSINRGAFSNRSIVVFPKTQFKYKVILEKIQAAGFIESFENRGLFLIIRLKQIYWKSWGEPACSLSKLTNIKRVKKKQTLSFSDIEKIYSLSGHAQLYLISTDGGILNGAETINHHKGGFGLINAK